MDNYSKYPGNIRIKDYTYVLPEDRIARYPLQQRDSSKLLVYRSGDIQDDIFKNLKNYLNKDDILVYNQTKVIRARLIFRKETGAVIEVFCLEPDHPSDYERNFSSRDAVEWQCLIGNRKKWKTGRLKMEMYYNEKKVNLYAEITGKGTEGSVVRFSWNNKSLCFSDILEITGRVPVPPYLNREDEEIDRSRYQTIYSKDNGSVAAPTAGLHFTNSVLDELREKGIKTHSLTLHVGAGTFVPVKTETIGGHTMHIEHFTVGRKMIEGILEGRIIAVGTTSLRTLESLYWLGHKISKCELDESGDICIEQWYPYDKETDTDYREYLKLILNYMSEKGVDSVEARTGIIIVPGYRMRIVKGLITNYHLPGSTLLLLVAAFTGSDWKKIYEYSIENNFRFLSYGDSSLLLP